MAVQTTYVSPTISTQAQKALAIRKAAELLEHLAAGTGGYTMDLVSIVPDLVVAHNVTIILTDALPAGQVARYNLTQTAP